MPTAAQMVNVLEQRQNKCPDLNPTCQQEHLGTCQEAYRLSNRGNPLCYFSLRLVFQFYFILLSPFMLPCITALVRKWGEETEYAASQEVILQ